MKLLDVLVVAFTVVKFATYTEASDAPVCYGYLGCFPMGPPWSDALRPVPAPQSPESVDTQFYLYTRARPQVFIVTKLPEISLQGSDYDGRKPTFFLSHGYQSSGNKTWMISMKDALLTRVDANVIVVSWAQGSNQLNYLQSVANTRVVAAELVRLVNVLLTANNAATSRFHLIAHSLGAHAMSYTAKRIPNIARITALDPAQPGYEGYGPEVRLDKTDANFVEVIHSNCRPFIPFLGLGMMGPVGHVDFYLNGGWDQPGCILPPTPPNLRSIYDLPAAAMEEISYIVKCPHQRSYYVFTASINNKQCTLWGHQVNYFAVFLSIMTGGNIAQFYKMGGCSKDSCSPVGLETINYPARGSFFVATTGLDPFCISEPAADSSLAQYRSSKDLPGM